MRGGLKIDFSFALKKLILKFAIVASILMIAGSLHADWQVIPSETDHKHFFGSKYIKKYGSFIEIWERIIFTTRTRYGDGSSEQLLKIDCVNGTVQTLVSRFYKDQQWSEFSWSGKRGQIVDIKSGSVASFLKKTHC